MRCLMIVAVFLLIPAIAFAQTTLRCVDAQGNLVLTQGSPPPGVRCQAAPGLAPGNADPLRWERDREQERKQEQERTEQEQKQEQEGAARTPSKQAARNPAPIGGPVLWTFGMGSWTLHAVYASDADCAAKRDQMAPSPARQAAIAGGVDKLERATRKALAGIGKPTQQALLDEEAAMAGANSYAELDAMVRGAIPMTDAVAEGLGLKAVGRCLPVGVSPR